MLLRVRLRFFSDRGNVAVEAALVLPFLLALLMGIVEFGRVLYFQQVLTNAARESSRASATGFEPYTTAANRVLSSAGIPSPGASCPGSPIAGNSTICQTVVTIPVGTTTTTAHQVSIAYNIPYMTPLGPLLDMLVGESSGWGSGITLNSSAVMRQ
jgi:Flp pilus assembly protein TadG